jgi:excisionase family DNA binding protein
MNAKSKEIQLLSEKQLAEVLNCSSRHVRRLTSRRGFPKSIRLGRLRRWSKTEVLEWALASRRR